MGRLNGPLIDIRCGARVSHKHAVVATLEERAAAGAFFCWVAGTVETVVSAAGAVAHDVGAGIRTILARHGLAAGTSDPGVAPCSEAWESEPSPAEIGAAGGARACLRTEEPEPTDRESGGEPARKLSHERLLPKTL